MLRIPARVANLVMCCGLCVPQSPQPSAPNMQKQFAGEARKGTTAPPTLAIEHIVEMPTDD